ncbi:MAG: nucleoside recognition domain-containing protein, partial [Dehalococcoidia bacterium]|nr:nucleoside recognition domain-containing protein [Dehalococcoidia bacterium]
QGISGLREACAHARLSSFLITFDPAIEDGIRRIGAYLPPSRTNPRGLALLLMSGDRTIGSRMPDRQSASAISGILQEVQSQYADPLSYVISMQRARRVEAVVGRVEAKGQRAQDTWIDQLGHLTMHPVWGVPFLLATLFVVFYLFVGRLGAGVGVDFLQSVVFNGYINPWATSLLDLVPVPLLQEVLVGPYGLITMGLTYAIAIVLPIVGFFFFAFGLLEDTGYLPRLAILSDRVLKSMGLNGKAVLPMVLGLGCVTMATMTTRILESRRERVIATLLLALGIPCSAQMAVILAMVSSLSLAATAVFVAVVLAQLLLVGFLAARVMPGESSDFILEIPPLRLPQLSNVLLKTVYAIVWFLKEAVPLFLIGTFLLFLGNKVGALQWLEQITQPIFNGFLGLPPRAAEAFIVGFLRRDYGAAGLLKMQQEGLLDVTQVVVSLVVITLFVPCIASFFVVIKETGLRTALLIVAFIFPFAVLVGGTVNFLLRWSGVAL